MEYVFRRSLIFLPTKKEHWLFIKTSNVLSTLLVTFIQLVTKSFQSYQRSIKHSQSYIYTNILSIISQTELFKTIVQCIRLSWVCDLTLLFWHNFLLILGAYFFFTIVGATDWNGWMNWCLCSLLVNWLLCIRFSQVIRVSRLLRDCLWDECAQVQTRSGTQLVVVRAGLALLAHQNAPFTHLTHVLPLRVRVQRAIAGIGRPQGVNWIKTCSVSQIMKIIKIQHQINRLILISSLC